MSPELLGKFLIMNFAEGFFKNESGNISIFDTLESAQITVGICEFEQSYIIQIVQDAEYDDNGDCAKFKLLDRLKTEPKGLQFAVGKL